MTGAGGPGAALVRVAVEAASCAEPELAALAGGESPVAPGGAAVGRVVAAGEGAAHLVGRRVLVGPVDGCGECSVCRRALPFACSGGAILGATRQGALAGVVEVRARWVCPLDGGLEVPGPSAALLAREAVLAYALAARVGLAAGDRARVVGGGPVAALARQVMTLRGARAGDDAEADAPITKVLVVDDAPGSVAEALALAGPGAAVAVRALGADGAEGMPALLARGGAVLGVPFAHPDLVPEVAALAVRGELDLAAAAAIWRPGARPLDVRGELIERLHAALADGRALVVDMEANGA